MSDNQIPVTWPSLLAANHDLLREGLDVIGEVPKSIVSLRPPWIAASVLGGPSLTLAHAAIVFGPGSCAAALETLVPLIPRMLTDFDSGLTKSNRVAAVQLLAFFNTAACCGADIPASVHRTEHTWPELLVPHQSALTERERYVVACAALVTNQIDLVPSLIGGGALATSLTPGQTFAFNVQGFVRYLAIARRNNATYDDIEPAWLNFVDRFPHKHAAGTLDWPDLLYAARVANTFNPDLDASAVADSLHQLVAGYR